MDLGARGYTCAEMEYEGLVDILSTLASTEVICLPDAAATAEESPAPNTWVMPQTAPTGTTVQTRPRSATRSPETIVSCPAATKTSQRGRRSRSTGAATPSALLVLTPPYIAVGTDARFAGAAPGRRACPS